jgi:hypothetical protein
MEPEFEEKKLIAGLLVRSKIVSFGSRRGGSPG